MNNRAHELQAIKVADAVGNTVLVSGVVTYRVVDAAKAALDIENLSDYVRVQAHATLKRVASRFPYISYDGAPSLVTEAAQLAERLRGELQAALRCAGVHVVSFQLSDLAYAPEIAQAMLVRQQAQAVLDARRTIVAGAVGIVADALRALEAQGAGVGDGDAQPARARLVTNLLTVLCSERGAQPVLDC